MASTLGACRSATTLRGVHGRAASDAQADPAAVIDYRGEEIRLTKRYDDYDDFENDPNNLAPEEYDHEVTVADGKVTYLTREGTMITSRPMRGQTAR